MLDKDLKRFWKYTDKRSDEECWNWLGHLSQKGYGRFKLQGKDVQSHRLSYEYFVGPLGDLFACHRCDNAKCVNPKHIFPGTHKQNMKDMAAKGRARGRGRDTKLISGYAVLTESDVVRIISQLKTKTNQELAEEFNITLFTVHDIRVSRTWKHLDR